MISELYDFVMRVFMASREQTTFDIMLMRGLLGYLFGMFLVRFHKHFLGFGSPFDIVVRIVVGSLLANAIGGSYSFLPTLLTIAGLIGINWFLGVLTWHYPSLEYYIKGPAIVLFKDNKFNTKALHRYAITHEDISKIVREQLHTDDLANVKLITLENSGKISVIAARNS